MNPYANPRMRAAQRVQSYFENWNKYYSTVRFQANRSGAGPYTWTIPSGTELRAFGYAQGQDMGGVGFPSGTSPATLAETNLTTASSTLSGETVEIRGLALLMTAESDSFIAKQLWANISVQASLNGDQMAFRLGTPEFIPCAGGLTGFGDSYQQTPPLAEKYVSRSGMANNGVAHVGNFLPFPAPILWRPQGEPDSTLIIKLKVERAITWTTTDVAPAAGVAGYTSPSGTAGTLGTYVTIKAHLLSKQISKRSANM